VRIENSKVIDSDNGVRIKTVSGATGTVTGVTFNGISLSNIAKYGIVIEQDYENGSPTGTPTTGVPITDLVVTGVKGSVASSGTNIYLLCGKGSCSNWTWSGNSVSGGKKSTKCQNIPGGGAAC
jgi:galacturan 1,4-alpha-galacturonidase